MKIFFVLFFAEFINVSATVDQRTAGGNEHFHPLKQVKKIRTKFLRHPSTQGKATFLPSGEQEQNRVLEKMSPEYKYEDYGDSENSNTKDDSNISNLLDKQTIQELKSKNLLDGDTKHATRGEPSFVKVLTPSRSSLGGESLEKFNVLLQNTLPEYKFDKAERGPGFSYGGCTDLDPDCWKYEMHGLCSDSPDLAEKRFNCKKTCHLCVSTAGMRRPTQIREKKQ